MKSLKLRELVETQRAALTYDFRTHYGLSLYDCVNGSISIREFYDLVAELLKTPGSRTRAEKFEIEEFSITDWNLIRVYNAIIASIDAKPQQKKKFIYNAKNPKNVESDDKPKKRQMTLKDLGRIKVAQKAEEVELSKANNLNKVYHVDRTGKVRKCRVNGIGCNVSNEHFDNSNAI